MGVAIGRGEGHGRVIEDTHHLVSGITRNVCVRDLECECVCMCVCVRMVTSMREREALKTFFENISMDRSSDALISIGRN